MAGDNVFCFLFGGFYGGLELREDKGDRAAGCGIFVFPLMDQLMGAIRYGGTVDLDTVCFEVDI